jgi:hypothetical protein
MSLPFEMILPIKNQYKYELKVDDLAKKRMSTRFSLKIKYPSSLDNGFYNCTVQNQYGSSHYNFEIRRRGKPLKILFLYIYGLCTTIFFIDENSSSFLTAMTLSAFFLVLITFLTVLIFVLFCIYRKRNLNDSGKKSILY